MESFRVSLLFLIRLLCADFFSILDKNKSDRRLLKDERMLHAAWRAECIFTLSHLNAPNRCKTVKGGLPYRKRKIALYMAMKRPTSYPGRRQHHRTIPKNGRT